MIIHRIPLQGRNQWLVAVSALVGWLGPHCAIAGDAVPAAAARPKISIDRWREDWSALANPALRTRRLDGLKYIPLSGTDPKRYLSFGLTVREIFESSDAPGLGTMAFNPKDSYFLQRAQVHVDAHLSENWQLFTQLEDVRAFDKTFIGPADANELDLRMAFLAYSYSMESGVLKLKIGRQDFVLDIERFVSAREGPNVRQSFDGVWAGWETPKWRVYGLVSQPVVYKTLENFDDTSTSNFRFSGLRLERQLSDSAYLAGNYALYEKRSAAYLDGAGEERRHMVGVHYLRTRDSIDADVEAMGQFGTVGAKDLSAWAFGARAGYTWTQRHWSPRLGLQFDAASGDRHPGDGHIETFNPLFPNGFYFALGGATGYVNVIHLKPSVSFKPMAQATVSLGLGALWRETTHDAVYLLPSVPIAATAGRGDAWTGAYAQLRGEYRFSPSLFGSVEFVRYDVGPSLRAAGARDSNYLRVEAKYSW